MACLVMEFMIESLNGALILFTSSYALTPMVYKLDTRMSIWLWSHQCDAIMRYLQSKMLKRQPMGHPSDAVFAELVSNNAMLNCPIAECDIDNAVKIFWPSRAWLCGKTVHKTACTEPAFVSSPKHVYDHLEEATLTGDVIFINGLALFITFTWKMKLVIAKFLTCHTFDQLNSVLKN